MVIAFFLFLIVFATLLFLLFCALMRHLSRSRLVIRRFVNPAYEEVKCPHCTWGAQYLDHKKGWGPIPVAVRVIVRGQIHMGPPQANIRRCSTCAGSGWVSTRRKTPDNVAHDYGPQEVTW